MIVKPYVAKEPDSALAVQAATSAGPAKDGAPRGVVVRFPGDSATLDAAAAKALRLAAEAIRTGVGPLTVMPHAAQGGDRAANSALARRRAAAVRDALVKDGVPAERIRVGTPDESAGSGTDANRVEVVPASEAGVGACSRVSSSSGRSSPPSSRSSS